MVKGQDCLSVCKRVVERKSEEPRFDGSLQKKWLTQFCTFAVAVVGQASDDEEAEVQEREEPNSTSQSAIEVYT